MFFWVNDWEVIVLYCCWKILVVCIIVICSIDFIILENWVFGVVGEFFVKDFEWFIFVFIGIVNLVYYYGVGSCYLGIVSGGYIYYFECVG